MTAPAARWLTENEDLLPRRGAALDVACGRGRNALWLAARGMSTHAIDRDPAAVNFVNDEALRLGMDVQAEVMDLEASSVTLGTGTFDAIVVIHYLHRPLFPRLVEALRPGGLLVYETFTIRQAVRGKPTNPDYLLRAGELLQLVEPLEVLRSREGDYENRFVASVIARRPRPRVPAPRPSQ